METLFAVVRVLLTVRRNGEPPRRRSFPIVKSPVDTQDTYSTVVQWVCCVVPYMPCEVGGGKAV